MDPHPNNAIGIPEASATFDFDLVYARAVVGAHRDGTMPCCLDTDRCWKLWFSQRLIAKRVGRMGYRDPRHPLPLPRISAPRAPLERNADERSERSSGFAGGLVLGAAAGIVGAVVVVGAALSIVIPY